ncbi:hypothetical protein AB6C54_24110 [Vibrio splendidus]
MPGDVLEMSLPVEDTTISDIGMHITAAQEMFSYAYVKLMCASAKIKYSTSPVDDESVDIEFVGSGFKGKWKRPRILAQLKCTS